METNGRASTTGRSPLITEDDPLLNSPKSSGAVSPVVYSDLLPAFTVPPPPTFPSLAFFRLHIVAFLKENWGVIGVTIILGVLYTIAGTLRWDLPWDGWVSLALLTVVLIALIKFGDKGPHIPLLMAMAFLMFTKILKPERALVGFANPGVISVAVLFIVAKGVEETHVLDLLIKGFLGTPKYVFTAQLRFFIPLLVISSFLNNTPVVAMMIPLISNWTKKINLNPAKFFMPLSFATVLGGTVTLIGTSTNLVVQGLAEERDPKFANLGIFEITPVGAINAVMGIIYIMATSRWLLPNRWPKGQGGAKPTRSNQDDPEVGLLWEDEYYGNPRKEFLVEVEIYDRAKLAECRLSDLKDVQIIHATGDYANGSNNLGNDSGSDTASEESIQLTMGFGQKFKTNPNNHKKVGLYSNGSSSSSSGGSSTGELVAKENDEITNYWDLYSVFKYKNDQILYAPEKDLLLTPEDRITFQIELNDFKNFFENYIKNENLKPQVNFKVSNLETLKLQIYNSGRNVENFPLQWYEIVISPYNLFLSKTISESDLENRYQFVVIAVCKQSTESQTRKKSYRRKHKKSPRLSFNQDEHGGDEEGDNRGEEREEEEEVQEEEEDGRKSRRRKFEMISRHEIQSGDVYVVLGMRDFYNKFRNAYWDFTLIRPLDEIETPNMEQFKISDTEKYQKQQFNLLLNSKSLSTSPLPEELEDSSSRRKSKRSLKERVKKLWQEAIHIGSQWQYQRMIIAFCIVILMISLTSFKVLPLLASALLAAVLMFTFQIVSIKSATEAVNMSIILTIAAAFAIGEALEETGVAAEVADTIVAFTESWGSIGLLAGVYVSTAILTELISNSAAVSLMFPIVWEILKSDKSPGSPVLQPKAAIYALMLAASSSFTTPVGYQTNMMVWEPGGIHFLIL